DGQRAVSSGGPSLMKEVVFSACLSSEVAWESGGHGEFTVRALQVMQAGIAGLTNEQFESRVTAQFGTAPRQHARLYCAPSANGAGLLQPGAAPAGGRALGDGGPAFAAAGLSDVQARALLQTLCSVAQQS